MSHSYAHLSPKAAEKVELSTDERISHIKQPRWIAYTRSKEILDKMEDLLTYPRQSRMPSMLVVGESNSGKTSLLQKFLSLHPADPNLEGEAAKIPILVIEAPPSPDEVSIYAAILRRLFKRNPIESTAAKRNRVLGVLSKLDLGAIAIDELNNLLAGSVKNQRQCLNALKYLSNELRVPLICFGTPEALSVVQIDPQIQNRLVPEVLPRWHKDDEFLRLLMSFERVLPLKEPSNLAQDVLAQKILSISEGTIGEVSSLLRSASIWAIKNGQEKLTLDALQKCGYVSPSLRKPKVTSLIY